MSRGSGVKQRARMVARRAYLLAQEGYTHRRIAELLGKDVKTIPDLIMRGERIADDPMSIKRANEVSAP